MNAEEKRETVLAVLNEHYPQFAVSDMEPAYYWKSLAKYEEGDVITHGGTDFRVRYSWEWMSYYGVPVYMCEIDPIA